MLPRSNKHGRLRSQYTEAIYGLRFSPYMIVLLRIWARRYTIVIRDHVIRQNTVVYGEIRTVYGRLTVYTDSVILDLGGVYQTSDNGQTYVKIDRLLNQIL
jgi:hypothetical protein